jgi:hypothetical protein
MAKSLLEQLPEIVANGEASSEQMLEALSTVAKMLETKASGTK